MGSHPVNLALRFLLEIAALVAIGYWGWTQHTGVLRFVLAIGGPVLAAVLWGTFAVPDDPSRSGKAPVAVPGIIRLALELAIFAFAAWALYDAGNSLPALILANMMLTLPFTVWVLTTFMRDLPRELEEAAFMDGKIAIMDLAACAGGTSFRMHLSKTPKVPSEATIKPARL